MSKYYLNQTLDVKLAVTFDDPALSLAQATAYHIAYRTPSRGTGTWQAAISGESLVYTVPYGVMNLTGEWAVWTYVEIGDKHYTGTPSNLRIYTPGT